MLPCNTAQADKPRASAAVATSSSSAPSPQEATTKATAPPETAPAPPVRLPLEFLRTVRLKLVAEELSRIRKRVPVFFTCAEDRAERITDMEEALDHEARGRPRGRRCRWGYKEAYRLEWWHKLFRMHVHSEVRRLNNS